MAIERIAPELDRLVSPGEDLEELGQGYLGGEGPIWYQEDQYLVFSDHRNNRRMKWSAPNGVSVFEEPTNNANGHTRDRQGRLIACEMGSRRVTRQESDGSVTVVASSYQGKRLNRPNDVVVRSDGSIYFTDPGAPDPELDLEFSGVYRVSPDLSTISLLVQDFVLPNGLAFSPDESVLYIDDSRRKTLRAFEVQPDGSLALATDRVLCEFTSQLPGVADGMKLDVEGNIYCAAPGGVWILDPAGLHLGTILTGAEQTTNCAWGGGDWKTLFITTREQLFRISLNIPGLPVPQGNQV